MLALTLVICQQATFNIYLSTCKLLINMDKLRVKDPFFRKMVRFNTLVKLTTCLILIRNLDYAVFKLCRPKAILLLL